MAKAKKKESRTDKIFRTHPELKELYCFENGMICTASEKAEKQKGKFKTISRNG